MIYELKKFKEKFVVFYFDDILICSLNLDSHIMNLTFVFMILRKETLYCNLKKCILFFQHKVVFLGYVVSRESDPLEMYSILKCEFYQQVYWIESSSIVKRLSNPQGLFKYQIGIELYYYLGNWK